jgi:DNA-binding NarL/FixJ family response regulator
MSLRIQICCDKAIMAAGMSALLQQHNPDVHVETSPRVVVNSSSGAAPDVLLVVAPVLTIDDRDQLAALSRQSKVILLAKPENAHRAFEALKVGVRAVISVDSSVEDLVHVIRTVVAVDAMVVPAVARKSLEHFADDPSATRRRLAAATLTPRETEVMLLLTEGRSNAEIARKLSVSDATVRTHVHHVLRKLGAGTRAQAVAMAYESQLIGEMSRKLDEA